MSSSSGLLLLPNLGGEEPGDWREMLRRPPIASAARLWRFLFPADARVVTEDASDALRQQRPEHEDTDDWPAALVGSADRVAFDWLSQCHGWQAWLCNERAHAEAAAHGASLDAPSGEIVERVHDKAFAAREAEARGLVARPLRGQTRIFEPDELRSVDDVLAAIIETTRRWPEWIDGRATLKPRMGTSGRGRLDLQVGELAREALARSLPRLVSRGGALLEPWLERSHDLSVQLGIARDGAVVVLGSLEILTTGSGGWQGHRGEIDSRGRVFSGLPQEEELREAGAGLAAAAAQQGYFGPAGLDALVFRQPDGAGFRERLRPVVELNARYTMGIVTIGVLRRALAEIRTRLGLEPGERRSFVLLADAPSGGWQRVQARLDTHTLLVPLGKSGPAAEDPQPALLVGPNARTLDAATSGR